MAARRGKYQPWRNEIIEAWAGDFAAIAGTVKRLARTCFAVPGRSALERRGRLLWRQG